MLVLIVLLVFFVETKPRLKQCVHRGVDNNFYVNEKNLVTTRRSILRMTANILGGTACVVFIAGKQ